MTRAAVGHPHRHRDKKTSILCPRYTMTKEYGTSTKRYHVKRGSVTNMLGPRHGDQGALWHKHGVTKVHSDRGMSSLRSVIEAGCDQGTWYFMT